MRTDNLVKSMIRPRLVLRTAARSRPTQYIKNTDKYHSLSGLNTAIYGNKSLRTESLYHAERKTQ